MAVPLIATTLTRDPLAIAVVGALAFLPWLVFGLPAGMIVDRFDRRIIMAVANGIRGAVALWLAILTATGQISLWALFAGTLVFGLGELHRDAHRGSAVRRRAGAAPVGGLGGLSRPDRAGRPASAVGRPPASRSRRFCATGSATGRDRPGRTVEGFLRARRSLTCGGAAICGRWSSSRRSSAPRSHSRRPGRSCISWTFSTWRRPRSVS
ncbi:MFS transporter [Microbacterium sp. zg.B48]|uniref:MFS transporter n=1 Tax=Microbacterium sp. zg.B48 TaxID=2969408 RepID=UPI00214B5E38|nr:MFS transporter [Microbacterium sp. zg.B48]MCR2763757.1 MFS transporter [Microbacterium sp. zg.B48]